jgi:hypothetical protein
LPIGATIWLAALILGKLPNKTLNDSKKNTNMMGFSMKRKECARRVKFRNQPDRNIVESATYVCQNSIIIASG